MAVPTSFLASFEHLGLARHIQSGLWYFAAIETIHIIAFTVLYGGLLVVDLRLLGFGREMRSVSDISRQVRPYMGTALVLALLTGFPLFASEAIRIGNGAPFQYKMLLLSVALILHFTIHSRATDPESETKIGFRRLAGGLSIVSWLGVAFAGRAIGFGFL